MATDHVRDLEVSLRSDLPMSDLIKAVTRCCFYNIRQLRVVKSSLTRDALRDAAYALILPRIDYCNSLYAGLQAIMIQRLMFVCLPVSISMSVGLHVCLFVCLSVCISACLSDM